MGLFDNVTEVVNRGTAAAGRTGRTARLRVQLSELDRQRHELMAQLGTSLYDVAKDDADLRSGREPLLDCIADLDARRETIEQQMAQIESEAQAAQRAALAYACPRCGTRVSGSQGFCSGCGLPVADIIASATRETSTGVGPIAVESVVSDVLTCVACGAPLEDGDVFCMSCGARQPQ